jgi:hypothetical protein
MTAWGASSLVQIVSTIQSTRTAETVVDRKGAVSAGIPVACFQRSRSLPTLTVSPGFFGRQSPHPKIPFPATEFRDGTNQPALGNCLLRCELRAAFGTYRGFNPRVSNCWLHSAGASRSRSTPMPRGKRPSTAALTRSGARNASEMVILTCRTLHFWRAAIC